MEIPFVGGAYAGRSKHLNAQICENWFPIVDKQDGKSILALMGTPGLKPWADTGAHGEARGAIMWSGYLYAVIGATLWKITSAKAITNVGTLSTSTGRVYMAGGTDDLCIVDGSYGYHQIDGATELTIITDEDFPDPPTSLCYIDGFFIVTKGDIDEYYISGLEDASSWDGLDWASAEDSPDDIILGHAYNRHFVIFGERTIEVHYNTGDASFPFTRVAGAVQPIGLGAAASVASGPEGLFFLDHQFQVRMGQGYESVVISTEQVEYQIRQYTDQSDAIGYTYTQEGHSFYVITFQSGGKTWAYDIITGMWHTRSSGLTGGRHRANWHVFFAGKNLVGDYRNGKIYELDLGTYDDDGSLIRSIRRAQVIQSNRKLMFHSALELDFETGMGGVRTVTTSTIVTGDELISNPDMEEDDGWDTYWGVPSP